MHLSTVHSSSYYSSSPSPTKMISTVNSLNMSMISRIMRSCRSCTTTNGANATTLFANPSTAHDFILHSSNIDSRENEGNHTMVIVGIIFGVLFGCLCVAALIGHSVKSNKKAYAASGGQRARVKHGNNAHNREQGDAYQGDGGLNPPPRSHGSRSNAPRFPGSRFGCEHARAGSKHSGRSQRSAGSQSKQSAKSDRRRGPYQDDTPFSAIPNMEEGRGSQGRGRGQYI